MEKVVKKELVEEVVEAWSAAIEVEGEEEEEMSVVKNEPKDEELNSGVEIKDGEEDVDQVGWTFSEEFAQFLGQFTVRSEQQMATVTSMAVHFVKRAIHQSSQGSEKERMREKFYAILLGRGEKLKSKSNLYTRQEYDEFALELHKLISNGVTLPRESACTYARFRLLDRRRLERFSLKTVGQRLIITERTPTVDGNLRVFVHSEQLFDTLWQCHQMLGHKGRDKMHDHLSKCYANVTNEHCRDFVSTCLDCQLKRRKPRKGIKAILSQEMNSRWRIDFIDYQTSPDGDFKFVMVYQDQLTKFSILRPLVHKTSVAVAAELVQMFGIFGAPRILLSDNGRELVKSLAATWPGSMPLVHTMAGHGPSQCSLTIGYMISCYLADKKTSRWASALPIIAFQKNSVCHGGIKRPPYQAMFGLEPLVDTTEKAPSISSQLGSLGSQQDLQRTAHYMAAEFGQEQEREGSTPKCLVCGCSCPTVCCQCRMACHAACGHRLEGDDEPLLLCALCHRAQAVEMQRDLARRALARREKRLLALTNGTLKKRRPNGRLA